MNPFSRTQFVLGREAMEKLKNARVAVFGLGGVGGYVVEALARSGVGALDLVDHDTISLTNINRQILATRELIYGKETLSLPKGHIEAGESHVDTAIRECFEETDIVLTEADAVRELEPYKIRFTDHHFQLVCKVIYPVVFRPGSCGVPRAKEARMIDAGFMDVKEFLSTCTYDNVKQIVRQAAER